MAFVVSLLGLLVWVSFSTWIGTRLGAQAVMRVAFPLPFMGQYAYWVATLPPDQVQSATCVSLLSLLMVFSFVLPYHLLLRLFGDRLPPARGALLLFTWAFAAACALRRLHEPLGRAIEALPIERRMGVASLLGIGLVLGAHLVLRPAASDEEPAPALCPLRNLMGRLLSLVAVLMLLHDEGMKGSAVTWVLSSIPRVTSELSAGTHAANGARSARQVLAGMPLGVLPAVLFVAVLGGLSLALPIGWAYAVAAATCLGLTAWLALDAVRFAARWPRPGAPQRR